MHPQHHFASVNVVPNDSNHTLKATNQQSASTFNTQALSKQPSVSNKTTTKGTGANSNAKKTKTVSTAVLNT